MQKNFLCIAGISGAIAVILGAFGAHKLRELLEPAQLQSFDTAVKYQMYHTLALLVVALLMDKFNTTLLTYAGSLFLIGILFFSGSVYLLSTRHLLGIENWKFLGPITPIGGLCFVVAWILLALSVIKK